ncbi:MAG: hypothetical protein GYA69_05835 [Candidatus Moranbacteria bacterium]|nr:hypothetical protein [Candidatus Moranbacteria bacterium]
MKTKLQNKFSLLLFAFAILFSVFSLSNNSSAANYPLEIINVEEVGENNRIRFAYPGIEYNVVIAAEGGAYPFVWELVEAPEGMVIDNHKGIITWTPIANGTSNVTVKVTDKEGNSDSESYSITVTDSTDRFLFIDENALEEKTGSITQPYANLDEIWDTDHGGKIVYFREGAYTIPHKNNSIRHASKTDIDTTNPFSYLGYPGETTIIDEECNPSITDGGDGLGNYPGYLFSWGRNDIYFGNLTFDNIYYYALSKSGSDYSTIYDCSFKNAYTSDEAANQSYINYMAGGSSDYDVIVGNVFEGPVTGGSNMQAVETYTTTHILIENNTIIGMPNYGVFFKDRTSNSTIRSNIFLGCSNAIGQYAQYGSNDIEICFNYIVGSTSRDLYIGPVNDITNHYIYRNTFASLGGINIRDTFMTNILLQRNIIQNDMVDSGNIGDNTFYRHRTYFRYVDAETYNNDIVFIDNLEGSSGLVDSNGLLIDRTYVGTYGHEIAEDEYWNDGEVDATPPNAPTGLLVS